jgi:hypothetical protein
MSKNHCPGLVPGTSIECGQNYRYCSERCRGRKETVPTIDARAFLDKAKARQDQKRQAREIAKVAGSYVR